MRHLLVTTACALSVAAPAMAQETEIRFTLDWSIQGIHSWAYLAQERGYFEDEGLDVTIDQGEGSSATVTRIMSGAYDAGFGDINALIQAHATDPEDAPVMVYQIYNQPPFAVLTAADGPVDELADLEGLAVGAPAGSASTRLFPALADAAGFDMDAVEIVNVSPSLQEQILVQGDVAASLVFNVTSYMNILGMGLDPAAEFTWYPYGDAGLDIYSNGVMASQEMIENDPEAVEGLVRAINRAMRDVIADPAAGIEAVASVEPLINAELERERLDFAMENLIVSDESRANGLGAVDPQRLDRAIDTIAELYELDSRPDVDTVYSDAFLPAEDERSF